MVNFKTLNRYMKRFPALRCRSNCVIKKGTVPDPVKAVPAPFFIKGCCPLFLKRIFRFGEVEIFRPAKFIFFIAGKELSCAGNDKIGKDFIPDFRAYK